MGGIDLSSLGNQRVPILGHLFGLFELLIGWLLAAIYAFIPSYGVAIILLTVLIRLLLMPITAKSTKSMAAMQKLQPEIKRLQAKYRNDRQRLNEELMALYKANNVNPAMGCLPLLAQMPVMIALYRVFYIPPGVKQIPISHLPLDSQLVADICGGGGNAGWYAPNGDEPDKLTLMCNPAVGYNVATAQFLGLNLTESPSEALRAGIVHFLPYAVLMLGIIGTAYYSQAQMTKRNKNSGQAQPQAMQTVTKIMPFFFGFISFTLPTAVNLYFLTTNIFQIGQQWFMFRKQDQASGEVVVPPSTKKKEAGGAKGTTRSAGAKQGGGPVRKNEGGRPSTQKKIPQKVPPKAKKTGAPNSNGDTGGAGSGSGGSGKKSPPKKRPTK